MAARKSCCPMRSALALDRFQVQVAQKPVEPVRPMCVGWRAGRSQRDGTNRTCPAWLRGPRGNRPAEDRRCQQSRSHFHQPRRSTGASNRRRSARRPCWPGPVGVGDETTRLRSTSIVGRLPCSIHWKIQAFSQASGRSPSRCERHRVSSSARSKGAALRPETAPSEPMRPAENRTATCRPVPR